MSNLNIPKLFWYMVGGCLIIITIAYVFIMFRAQTLSVRYGKFEVVLENKLSSLEQEINDFNTELTEFKEKYELSKPGKVHMDNIDRIILDLADFQGQTIGLLQKLTNLQKELHIPK